MNPFRCTAFTLSPSATSFSEKGTIGASALAGALFDGDSAGFDRSIGGSSVVAGASFEGGFGAERSRPGISCASAGSAATNHTMVSRDLMNGPGDVTHPGPTPPDGQRGTPPELSVPTWLGVAIPHPVVPCPLRPR